MVWWLRIHLSLQGTQVRTLAGKLRSHMLQSNYARVLQLESRESKHSNECSHVMHRRSYVWQVRPKAAKQINFLLPIKKKKRITSSLQWQRHC